MNINKKNNLTSIFLTLVVIVLLILSGPASAIDINLTTPDIDHLEDDTIPFTIVIQVNDGEFLPLLYTDLTFDFGGDSLICRINEDNTIDNCGFLTVDSREITDLNSSYNYGYGYGYGYQAPNYGYGYEFGYGYGYGYGERGIMGGAGSGTITYNLTVDVSEIPVEFLNNEVDVEAKVYGGTESNYRYFTGTSSFNVIAQVITPVDPTQDETATYPNVVISIPANALPTDATQLTIKQVAPTADPANTAFKILGKVYDFSIDSSTTTFNNFVQITITYTDEELAEAGITDESKIFPSFYNTATGDWEQLTVISRDPDNNKLTFETTHFTQFALLADTSTPATPTTSYIGGTGASPTKTYDNVLVPPAPEEPEEEEEEVPVEEPIPTTTTPEEETAPTGLAAITGAVIGALGSSTGLSIIALFVLIFGAITGNYFWSTRKKKK